VTTQTVAMLVKLVVFLGILLTIVPGMVWVERRGGALMQDRPGPNRLGPLGLFQPLADALKFIFKEDVLPKEADRLLYLMAPVLALLPAFSTFVVIPLGPTIELDGVPTPMMVADVDTGVLLFLALASLGIYSLIIGGYASNNKYSLLGSIRAGAQMISYELALTLSVVAVLLPVESFRLDTVVEYQVAGIWNIVPQAIGFFVFLVAAFAETNRLPFDLPEAESELVAGYHTEYSAMRFAAFFMAEYAAMTVLSALAATLYLGGWHLPGVDLAAMGIWGVVIGAGVLIAKVMFFMFLFVWVRWSWPRFRFDQLMAIGWKVLLPLALLNLVWVAAGTLAGWL
jgi:NADH-quinone oxidoreductase subunit H